MHRRAGGTGWWTPPHTLLAVVLTLAACGDDRPSGLPRDEVLPLEAALTAAADVGARGCGPREHMGSGSFVGDDLVVTAAHVVAGSAEIRVIDARGGETSGAVVHFDPDLDVALLRTSEANGAPVPLRGDEAEPGEAGVIAVLQRHVSPGVLDVDPVPIEIEVRRVARINTTDIYLEDAVQRAGFELTGAVEPGHSGALVVLPGGGAGIVWARSNRLDDSAWAIDLPPIVTDEAARAALVEPVDTGRCLD